MPLPTAVTMPNLVILRSQNWGALGHRPLMVWAWLTHRYTLLRTGYRAEFGLSRGNGMSDIKAIRLKIWPFASCLSRSLKVIGTDTDRSATCDFLVTFYFNHGPISYRFRDKRQFQSNSQIFPTRVYFTPPPLTGFPLELDIGALGLLLQKPEWSSYRAKKEVWRYLQPSGYNTRTRWTDGQTDNGRQQRPRFVAR